MKAHHTVTRFELLDARADFHDGAGKLVTQNLGRRDVAVFDFLDVRAANSARCDTEQHLALADFGNGDGFDDDASFAAVDAGAHMAQGANWRVVDLGGCVAHPRVFEIAIRSRLDCM